MAARTAAAKAAEAAPVESNVVEMPTIVHQHAAAPPAFGVTDEVKALLGADIDPARVKKKPGKGYDYLTEHDVIRTANRIFGYGRWGTDVVELVCLGTQPMQNKDGKDGWYTGYRCTVRLDVAGCKPVTGVGYGDAFESQWSAQITTHELAVKEAESDAIKRAFKKWGDQFGLILYAKADDKQRIAEEKALEAYNAPADQALVDELQRIAAVLGNEAISKAIVDEVAEHGHVRAGWGERALAKAQELAAGTATPPPVAEPEPVDNAGYHGLEGSQPATTLAEGDRVATDDEVSALIELAARISDESRVKCETALANHRQKTGGVVSAQWLKAAISGAMKQLSANIGTGGEYKPPVEATGEPTGDEVSQAFEQGAAA